MIRKKDKVRVLGFPGKVLTVRDVYQCRHHDGSHYWRADAHGDGVGVDAPVEDFRPADQEAITCDTH